MYYIFPDNKFRLGTLHAGKTTNEGCLTVHLPHEITRNVNVMQQDTFINVFLVRYVSGTYAHYHEQ